MNDDVITIMAKAMETNRAHLIERPIARIYPDLATAGLDALRTAGYWVGRGRAREGGGRPGEPFLGFSPDDGQPYPMRWVEYGQDEADEIGASGWLGYTEPLLNDLAGGAARPTHFTPLPPPPVQTEGGGG